MEDSQRQFPQHNTVRTNEELSMHITPEIYQYRVSRLPTPDELAACQAPGGWDKEYHLPTVLVDADPNIGHLSADMPMFVQMLSEDGHCTSQPIGHLAVCMLKRHLSDVCYAAMRFARGLGSDAVVITSIDELRRAQQYLRDKGVLQSGGASVADLDCRIQFKERMAEEGITKRDLARKLKVTNREVERFFKRRPESLYTSGLWRVADALGLTLKLDMFHFQESQEIPNNEV